MGSGEVKVTVTVDKHSGTLRRRSPTHHCTCPAVFTAGPGPIYSPGGSTLLVNSDSKPIDKTRHWPVLVHSRSCLPAFLLIFTWPSRALVDVPTLPFQIALVVFLFTPGNQCQPSMVASDSPRQDIASSSNMATDPNSQPRQDAEPDKVERVMSADEVEFAKDHQNVSKVDKELAQYVSDVRIEISPEKNAQLLRMIDKRVLSVMVATYFLQAIDKGTLSFASIMGIREDTNLTGQDYSWLTTCIYITILIVEYPQNWTIARVPIAKYLSFSIVAWGVVLACTAACHNFLGLVIVRTLLGLFESACQPAFVVLSSIWYRREEQAARVTFWYMMNGVSNNTRTKICLRE